MASELLPTLIPFFGCVIERAEEGARLTGAGRNFMNSAALTTRAFRAPFRLTAVAQTDSTNVRLYWHLGEIILNWECSVRQLRVHDPSTGKQVGVEDQGFLTVNDWHEIVWDVRPASMRLVVDGQVRFWRDGDYSKIESAVGIGPCFGSTVTVKSFQVEEG